MGTKLSTLLDSMVLCKQCGFADDEYPPLAPARLSEKVKVMFIGENPSWEFGQRIPFDGITNSGKALHENYLVPLKKSLGLKESDFWITDLFKCRYKKEIYREKSAKQELIHGYASTCAKAWLTGEITLTQPQIIVTLGDKEVYQRLRKIFQWNTPGKFSEAAYKTHQILVDGHKCLLLPACHPDISFENPRKPLPSKKWSAIHAEQFTKAIKSALV